MSEKKRRKKISIGLKKAYLEGRKKPFVLTSEARALAFWSHVKKTSKCWLWEAYRDEKGYGKVTFFQKVTYAHIISYKLIKGEIPKGFQLDHICRNTSCVNPDHLEPVTARENMIRGFSPCAINARKKHCNNGHFLNNKNVYVRKDNGGRQCKACLKNRRALRLEEKRDEINQYQRDYYKKTKGVHRGYSAIV